MVSNSDISKVKFPKKISKKFISSKSDRPHIALVVISPRKILLSRDAKFRADVNSIPKVSGVKPEAIDPPVPAFYQ